MLAVENIDATGFRDQHFVFDPVLVRNEEPNLGFYFLTERNHTGVGCQDRWVFGLAGFEHLRDTRQPPCDVAGLRHCLGNPSQDLTVLHFSSVSH